jgi:hypothetical protein
MPMNQRTLVDFMEMWQRTLEAHYRSVVVRDLPCVPIDGSLFAHPHDVCCVYFLRRSRHRRTVLYVGRATKLGLRWGARFEKNECRWQYEADQRVPELRVRWHGTDKTLMDSHCHHRLVEALVARDVMLHWLELPQRDLAAVEAAMIRIHRPKWNGTRG